MTPSVSVIIAAYNAAEFISKAVQSVLDQSYSDLEIVVINDGSTDSTADELARFEDPRIRVIHQDNRGQTAAKNLGIEVTSGEFVAFCDADDFWYPFKLEVQLPMFRQTPAIGVVYSNADAIDENGRPISHDWLRPHRGDVLNALFCDNFVPFGTAVVRRRCLEQVGAFDSSLNMAIDWELWLRIAVHFEFEYCNQATYAYRVWDGQMSSDWQGRYKAVFPIMRDFLQRYPGRISLRARARAYATRYRNRARHRRSAQPVLAVRDSIMATALAPHDMTCWREVAKSLLASAGVRRQ